NGQSASLQRPFYSLDARWAAGVGASEGEGTDTVYNAGNSIAEYRHRHQAAETFGGWSPGLVNGWTRRYSIGVSRTNDQYSLDPSKTAPERLPSDLELVGPFVRFQLIQDEYRQNTNLNLIGRVEDFAMGIQVDAQLGRALESFGSTRDSWLYSLGASNGFDLTSDSFVLTNASASGRYA